MRSLFVFLIIATIAVYTTAVPKGSFPLSELKHVQISQATELEPQEPHEQASDHGCPSSTSCNNNCVNAYRCRSGYCGGALWMTCYCVC